MSRLPKPLFKWEPELFKEPIYVLQAYNYRISKERAKVIFEETGIELAERIISWLSEDHLQEHKDSPVLAATCVEFFVNEKFNKDASASRDDLRDYLIKFGDTDLLALIEDKVEAMTNDIIKSMYGRRAKYELAYTLYIMKCHCMNFYTDSRKIHGTTQSPNRGLSA
jgi:hypothetical protein